MQSGIAARNQGSIQLSIDLLSRALDSAPTEQARTRASIELAITLLQARRLDEAEKFLLQAHATTSGMSKALVAVELGNLAVTRKNGALAYRYYDEADALSGGDRRVRLPARINRARLLAQSERLPVLTALMGEIAQIGEPSLKARLYLSIGMQARQLGAQGLETAYRSFAEAYRLVPQLDTRLALETLDALAQLYEDQDRLQEALLLTQSALDRTGADDALHNDILVRLEWRNGRILQRAGNRRGALLAYQNAARHIEAIRSDLPIEYEDGRSSYQETLRPIFNGLVDLILRNMEDTSEHARAGALRSAINAIELNRQSEMQDFLGDRCAVDGVRNDTRSAIPARSAVLYPVMLPDRLELLLDTDGVILRRTVNVSASQLSLRAQFLATTLTQYQSRLYLPGAQEFYDWLLRPFEAEFAKRDIQMLVVVPDGPLRLIPMGALHDGRQFAIERFGITTVSGISMTSVHTPARNRVTGLLAGMSEPGPVVDHLVAEEGKSIVASAPAVSVPASGRAAPHIRSARLRALPPGAQPLGRAERAALLKKSLALPGVKEEIQGLQGIVRNVSLLDQSFTLDRFTKEVASGDYRIVHIASHGVFGGSAESSYIMTHDHLLTMNRLELLIKGTQDAPIELLTLSACETAEGNERAPLGISGAAIKAQAKSVLGTLWPVDDDAARTLMEKFYRGLVQRNYSKSMALQAAQKELIADEAFSHPFFWAPFLLIGNWL